jgi:DNA helicase-2/ATP-dependent DNA helicase PcrA
LNRIINEPPRGLGKTSLLNYFSGNPSTPLRVKKLKEFFGFLKTIEKTAHQKPLSKTLAYIIKESGYQDHLNDGSEENMIRSDNLKELLVLSMKYDGLKPPLGVEKFLEDAALMSDQDTLENKNKKVRLMTVHAAKGLEFPCVFLSGLEEGLFPFVRFAGNTEYEEERRLFYVALTRAKEKLCLSFAYSRNFFGDRQINKPSRFINEIPSELFDNHVTYSM